MKKYYYLYLSLFCCIFIQIFLMRHITWFPDVILLMVVFTGIFQGTARGMVFGYVTGFLRGCFSAGTFFLDIFLFPITGMISSILANMFYKQNPVVQIFISAVGMFIVIVVYTVYFNITSGNTIRVITPLMTSWKPFIITVLFSPVFFIFLKRLIKMKD